MERFRAEYARRPVMKQRVCILLNRVEEYDFEHLTNQYLPPERFKVEISDRFPLDPQAYQLIIPWNYQRILGPAYDLRNVVVMHSSALPEGRGWAPIYYSLAEQKPEHVISGIFTAEEVDTGDIIVRARFPIKAGYTAPFIRKVDQEVSLLLISKILEKWPSGGINAVRQSEITPLRRRRHAQDNMVKINKSLKELLPHLRAVEPNAPAFFFYQGQKYFIEIRPEVEPLFPEEIIIEYPGLNQVEIWNSKNDFP